MDLDEEREANKPEGACSLVSGFQFDRRTLLVLIEESRPLWTAFEPPFGTGPTAAALRQAWFAWQQSKRQGKLNVKHISSPCVLMIKLTSFHLQLSIFHTDWSNFRWRFSIFAASPCICSNWRTYKNCHRTSFTQAEPKLK